MSSSRHGIDYRGIDGAVTSVRQALEVARESEEGARHPTVVNILDIALADIWRKVEAHPTFYVMSRDEFAVFTFFQNRFVGNRLATDARRRYWDQAVPYAEHASISTSKHGYGNTLGESSLHSAPSSPTTGGTPSFNLESPTFGGSTTVSQLSSIELTQRDEEFDEPTHPAPKANSDNCDPGILGSDRSISDPSAGFETDSTLSRDETSWDEDESLVELDPAELLISDILYDQIQSELSKGSNLESLVLSPFKRALVDRLMEDFWSIFNQEWLENVRKCVGATSSSALPSASTPQTSSSGVGTSQSTGQKRRIEESGQPSDEESGEPKRHQIGITSPADSEGLLRFACPYRKHDPRKYTHLIRNWRSCALTSFVSVARVKGHLYQRHRIFQCERCSKMLKDEHELNSHFMAAKTCDLQPPIVVDGITCKLERQLRSRKKAHSNQTQEERWKAIYHVLFPLEIIPNPYFELPREEDAQSPGETELLNYEAYSRRELPRIFQSALEEAINQETEPIADRLRAVLVSMIQECQDRVFSTYRARITPNSTSPLSGSNMPLEMPESNRITGEEENDPVAQPDLDALQSFFQAPPYQQDVTMGLIELDRTQLTQNQNEYSDSGYASNLSGHQNNSSSTNIQTSRTSNGFSEESFDQQTVPSRLEETDTSQMSALFSQFLQEDVPLTPSNIIENDMTTMPNTDLSTFWALQNEDSFD